MKKLILYFLTILVTFGCSTNSNDEVERTYPEAFSFEITSIQQLRNEVVPPDSLNLQAFVVGTIACPKDATCVAPDGIFLSESKNPPSSEEKFFLVAHNPQQFEEDQPYTISVAKRINSNGTRTSFSLLGYSLLNLVF